MVLGFKNRDRSTRSFITQTQTFTPDLNAIHRNAHDHPWSPNLSLSERQTPNSCRWDLNQTFELNIKRDRARHMPTSVPTFIRSTRSLLTFMASPYRWMLCALLATLSSQELLTAPVWYFRARAKATPTQTPQTRTQNFDLYPDNNRLEPPLNPLCCRIKTVVLARASPARRGVTNTDQRVVR